MIQLVEVYLPKKSANFTYQDRYCLISVNPGNSHLNHFLQYFLHRCLKFVSVCVCTMKWLLEFLEFWAWHKEFEIHSHCYIYNSLFLLIAEPFFILSYGSVCLYIHLLVDIWVAFNCHDDSGMSLWVICFYFSWAKLEIKL